MAPGQILRDVCHWVQELLAVLPVQGSEGQKVCQWRHDCARTRSSPELRTMDANPHWSEKPGKAGSSSIRMFTGGRGRAA